MNKYLYLTILFIHNVSSFILPPKIYSISRFYNNHHNNHNNNRNNLTATFMNNNNNNSNNNNDDNNNNNKNRTRIYKIRFNNNHLKQNYENNDFLFYKLMFLISLSGYLYQIIYNLILLS
jgi:hypothetical protein